VSFIYGGGGGGGSTFEVTWNCTNAAALDPADWKTTDPSTVNGVVMTSHNDAATDVVQLDGSTGLVMRTTAGVRSITYGEIAPATMLLADVQASVGGSWNQYTERLFFQARVNGTTALYQGCGITLAENATPLDSQQVFFGTANGTLQYQIEATRARSTSITVPSDILLEIILGQWGMCRWRLVEWPGSWPDPDTFTPLSVTNGYYLDGTPASHVMDLAADKWTPGNAHWGFCVWHNAGSPNMDQFTETVRGWRTGKITVPS
jgi:hypothetical protein